MRISLTVLVFGLAAGVAQAQTPSPPLPQNDITASIGWLGAQYPGLPRYERWHHSLFTSAGGGHYWTDHMKTEVEAAWLSRVSFDSYEPIDVDGGTANVATGYRYQDLKLSLAQGYQFGRNAWVHPYLAGGVDLDYLRQTEDRPAQGRPVYFNNRTGSSVSFPSLHTSESSVRVRPFAKAGFKMYLSDRTFFTTEWKVGLGNGLQHVLWKTGFGVDF